MPAVDKPKDQSIAEFFEPVLSKIPDDNRARALAVLEWVRNTYPHLVARLAWNQPMFTDHGTFIIGFSYASKHMAVAPETAGMIHFEEELEARGISHGSKMFRMPWSQDVPFDLLSQVIEFNIADKKDVATFWR